MRPAIVWFRNDLRLADNPALRAALDRGGPVVPLYILQEAGDAEAGIGAASRWWLHHSLAALAASLHKAGSRLVLRRGTVLAELQAVIRATGADAVFCNDSYDPEVVAHDSHVRQRLTDDDIAMEATNGSLLYEPWTIQNKAGQPYRVFTPFWKACLATGAPPLPLPAPRKLPAPEEWPVSVDADDLQLLPATDWAAGLRAAWQPGERQALSRLRDFVADDLAAYAVERDRPDHQRTSRLSPHLHFGEISPRQVWHACAGVARHDRYLAEIGWREFAHHLLFHFPETRTQPLRDEFRRFPWSKNPRALSAWQRGATGYPFVDAGMRELWTTGWMHNRVRMVVGSFLVKDLLVHWRRGAEWFEDTLVDADIANNTLGWQWVAGSGADAAPYFRIFNPVGQGQRFDPDGAYVRRWVPELKKLPARWIHQPFAAPASVLEEAGVRLGETYPEPIVDHALARQVALEAYRQCKSEAG